MSGLSPAERIQILKAWEQRCYGPLEGDEAPLRDRDLEQLRTMFSFLYEDIRRESADAKQDAKVTCQT